MFVDGTTVNKNFFQEGDLIFKEGDPGDAAFIVETGSVGIFKNVEGEEIHLATMNPGELFGEMAIIDGSERMAHAVALEESVIVSVPRTGLEAMLAKHEPFVKTLIQILVDNLRTVHEAYMKRPRSVSDYMSAVDFQVEGFRQYLDLDKDADPAGEGKMLLDDIDRSVTALRRLFAEHEDKRSSVLEERRATPKGDANAPSGETKDAGES